MFRPEVRLPLIKEYSRILNLLEVGDLEKRIPGTLADTEDLIRDYASIREQGYSLEDETFSLEVMGISVPIFGKSDSAGLLPCDEC